MKFAWFRKLVLPSKKTAKGFPTEYISKSDEIRCQVMPDILQHKEPMVVTEKN